MAGIFGKLGQLFGGGGAKPSTHEYFTPLRAAQPVGNFDLLEWPRTTPALVAANDWRARPSAPPPPPPPPPSTARPPPSQPQGSPPKHAGKPAAVKGKAAAAKGKKQAWLPCIFKPPAAPSVTLGKAGAPAAFKPKPLTPPFAPATPTNPAGKDIQRIKVQYYGPGYKTEAMFLREGLQWTGRRIDEYHDGRKTTSVITQHGAKKGGNTWYSATLEEKVPGKGRRVTWGASWQQDPLGNMQINQEDMAQYVNVMNNFLLAFSPGNVIWSSMTPGKGKKGKR